MNIQAAIASTLQQWLVSHPTIAWVADHPLPALFLSLLVVFLLWSLLGAITRLMEQVWIAVLALPLKSLRFLFNLVMQPLQGLAIFNAEPPDSSPTRLAVILARLEELKQEEQTLMQEMKALLTAPNGQKPPAKKLATGGGRMAQLVIDK